MKRYPISKRLLNFVFFYPKHCLPWVIILFYISSSGLHAAVLQTDKQWPQNQVLNVLFLDGDKALRDIVKKYAPLWVEKTNLTFKFFDSPNSSPQQTHIRISFLLQNGSRLGNHGDYHSLDATMNLFDLSSKKLSLKGEARLVLHEFGHALGLIHEYRSPEWPFGDNIQNQIRKGCLPKMMRIGYSKQEAKNRCFLVNQPINKKEVQSTAYDEFSIMNYPVTFTLDSGTDKTIKRIFSLSYLDRYAIQLWYPR